MKESRALKEFIELTSISSPSMSEKQMAETLKRKLSELGFSVCEDDAGKAIGGTSGNVIGVLKGSVGKPVLLAAHMDRVAGGDNIRHIITEEKITSDGTTILAADDVSGIVAILEGVRLIKESGIPHCDIEVAFTVCEERLAMGSKHLDYSLINAKHSYCFDSPGRIGRIINSAPSKVQFFVDVYGKSAHAGQMPEKGVNALVAAAKILADIKDGRIDFETTANWAIIKAGDVTNVVCEHTQIVGEARSRNQQKLNDYVEYVKEHCEKVISDTEARLEMRVENCFNAFNIPSEDELLTTLCGAMKDMGIEPLIEGGGGGMDANRFNEKGIKSVGVATGYFNNHSNQEELYTEDLNKSAVLVKNLIQAYSNKR